ncbi:MAG TPA: hypothetical protein PLQ35_15175 [bacterium]|nr:hypothetical protein [bacterium]HQL63625.1 hypothetical protein [bacterium]
MTEPTVKILIADLLKRFRVLHTEPPKWAWPFEPSIPFIGERYQPGRSLLIYASAENFSKMNREQPPEWFKTDDVWNRYRAAYEAEGRNTHDFFPAVGIAPVNDGGLLAAGLFLAEKLGLPARKNPRAFLETLAVSNWCKFTIRDPGGNRDYISDVKKLTESLPFVVAELAALQPAIVLIPKAVWHKPILSASMRGASPFTRFIPAPQCNPRVVYIHLAKHDHAARVLQQRVQGTTLAEWMQNLVGFNENKAWRYIAMLDGLLKNERWGYRSEEQTQIPGNLRG